MFDDSGKFPTAKYAGTAIVTLSVTPKSLPLYERSLRVTPINHRYRASVEFVVVAAVVLFSVPTVLKFSVPTQRHT